MRRDVYENKYENKKTLYTFRIHLYYQTCHVWDGYTFRLIILTFLIRTEPQTLIDNVNIIINLLYGSSMTNLSKNKLTQSLAIRFMQIQVGLNLSYEML